MKVMNKLLTLLLCMMMVVTAFAVTASAAATEPNVTIDLPKTEVNAGDEINVWLGVKEMTAASVAFGLEFDTTLLQVMGVSAAASATLEYSGVDDFGDPIEATLAATSVSTKTEANADGRVGAVWASGTEVTYTAKAQIVRIKFKALKTGTVKFDMFEDSSGVDGYKGEWTYPEASTPTTVTISFNYGEGNLNGETFPTKKYAVGTVLTQTDFEELKGEREGYTFVGFTTFDGTPISIPYEVTESTMFVAVWEQNCDHSDTTKYTYESIDGNTHKVTCECGEVVAAAENHDYTNGACSKCSRQCSHDNDVVDSTYLGKWSNDDGNTHSEWALCDCGTQFRVGSTIECTVNNADGDCTTAENCECGREMTPASAGHVEEADDGDCTTAVKCKNCDQIVIEAKAAHADAENDDDHKCDVCGTDNISEHEYMYPCDPYCCICHELTNPEATHSITHVEAKPGTDCQTYDGHMEYWTCSHCGGVWTDENLMSPTNMMNIKVNGEHTYTYNCDTNCKVCEELTRPEAKHEGGTATCVTKAVCQYCETAYGELAKCTSLTPINGKDATCKESGWKEYWKCFTCNTLYADSDATKKIDDFAAWKSEGGEGYIAVDPDNHVGHSYYDITATTHQSICSCGEAIGGAEAHNYNGTVPYTCVCGAKFTGWDTEIDGEDDVTVHTFYVINGVRQYSGWTNIDGDWYYLSTTSGYRAEGLSRVPYPTVAINGVEYKADQDAIDHCAPETFIDATTAWFSFNADGKFQSDFTGLTAHPVIEGAKCYAEKGMIAWHPGFVTVDNTLYYFIGDLENGGNKYADGETYIIRPNGVDGYEVGDVVIFENGKIATLNGVVDGYYYKNGQLMLGKGLVKIGDKYIYVRSNGQLATGTYYTPDGSKYEFDANGYSYGAKNGIYDDVYYENGHVAYGKGLVEYKDGYIYVRSNGQLATGTYYAPDGTKYEFDENGYCACVKNGVVDGMYYVNGHVAYGAGLIKIGEDCYYVRSNGMVATGEYYIANANDMEGFTEGKMYVFGADGKLTVN